MDRPTTGLLTFFSCDYFAECYDVSEAAYKELWNAMADAKPLRELIDIENSCPNDELGFNSPAKFWDKFSDPIKTELLALAEASDAEDKAWQEEFERKYPPRT